MTTKGHHLILGEVRDFISGKIIPDTHDERYRQKIARFLVDSLGYAREEINSSVDLIVQVDNKSAQLKIDFTISLFGKIAMIVKFGPGSLVTRHRPALAISRLLSSYQIPFVVVTNGKDSETLDGFTGKVIFGGIESIPSRKDLLHLLTPLKVKTIHMEQVEMESRILYAFEVDDSCPCDDNICRL